MSRSRSTDKRTSSVVSSHESVEPPATLARESASNVDLCIQGVPAQPRAGCDVTDLDEGRIVGSVDKVLSGSFSPQFQSTCIGS